MILLLGCIKFLFSMLHQIKIITIFFRNYSATLLLFILTYSVLNWFHFFFMLFSDIFFKFFFFFFFYFRDARSAAVLMVFLT